MKSATVCRPWRRNTNKLDPPQSVIWFCFLLRWDASYAAAYARSSLLQILSLIYTLAESAKSQKNHVIL